MSVDLYIVMGVCGSGKSLMGAALAKKLGVEFVEGDAYHPAENVERMAKGIPLTDGDREGWLRALAVKLGDASAAEAGLVVSCSALKRSYRDILRSRAPEVRLVFLKGTRALIAERLAGRRGHFMPAALLDSQLATLEEPAAAENVCVCDVAESPSAIVGKVAAHSWSGAPTR